MWCQSKCTAYMWQPLTIKAILDTSKPTVAKTNLSMNELPPESYAICQVSFRYKQMNHLIWQKLQKDKFQLNQRDNHPPVWFVFLVFFSFKSAEACYLWFLDCLSSKVERLKPTSKHPALDLRVGAATATAQRVLPFDLLWGDKKTGCVYSAAATC